MQRDVQSTSVKISLELTPSPTAAGDARALLRAFCTANDFAEDCEVAALVATELVANAVRHAGTALTVTVEADPARLHVAVTDRSPQEPRTRSAQLLDEGGRGLFLVETLSERWGVEVGPEGKTVWADIGLRAPVEPAKADI